MELIGVKRWDRQGIAVLHFGWSTRNLRRPAYVISFSHYFVFKLLCQKRILEKMTGCTGAEDGKWHTKIPAVHTENVARMR